MSLTAEQKAVIHHPGGHAKVMAVAGAGKTTTLVYFVLQCLKRNLPAKRILVLMYNKAAQEDFTRKLHKLHQSYSNDFEGGALPEVRTFHSLGLRIYKQLIQQGHLPSFDSKLLTDGEVESQVWRILQQCADAETAKDILDQKGKWVEPAVNFIDLVKSTLKPPEVVFEASGLPAQCRFFADVFTAFEQWRKAQKRITFSDMLYDPCCVFHRQPEVAAVFSGHMMQIIVDEYQDINEIQQFLVSTLRGDRGDLMVVGDPDQTIYEFRGSRPEFMTTEFDQAFSGVSLYNLSNTFRYGHRLSLLCNHLISNNPNRDGVLCLSHSSNPKTSLTHRVTADYAKEIISVIREESERTPLKDIAVLNRIWAISAPIELAFLENNIPYRLDHSLSVLDRYELAPFESLLLIAAGRYETLEPQAKSKLLMTLLTNPYPKIRRTVLQDIVRVAVQMSDAQPGLAIRQAMPETLSNRQADQLLVRSRLMDDAQAGRFRAAKLLSKYFHATDMEEGIREGAFSSQQIDDRLETVRAFIRYFRGLDLSSDTGWQYWQDLRSKRQSKSNDGVRLTSMHRSKGLEWSCVIIPGLSDRFMPYRPDGELTVPASVESERRLLYVAMTRAKERLYLLTPEVKKTAKKGEKQESNSPFFYELQYESSDLIGTAIDKSQQPVLKIPATAQDISKEYLVRTGHEITLDVSVDEQRLSGVPDYFSRNAGKRKSGQKSEQRVFHQTYGEGVIISDEARYWVILFDTGEQKQFDKRVAAQYLDFLV
ncbi:ATP-dependent helicase [Litoribacillus peritrichatus]|uniref:DNA 3'-5' helicase n=1 Tax=Litoribacillus peritrichatus TaxID=718191 RepID=A0ABP7MC83_9GAMM